MGIFKHMIICVFALLKIHQINCIAEPALLNFNRIKKSYDEADGTLPKAPESGANHLRNLIGQLAKDDKNRVYINTAYPIYYAIKEFKNLKNVIIVGELGLHQAKATEEVLETDKYNQIWNWIVNNDIVQTIIKKQIHRLTAFKSSMIGHGTFGGIISTDKNLPEWKVDQKIVKELREEIGDVRLQPTQDKGISSDKYLTSIGVDLSGENKYRVDISGEFLNIIPKDQHKGKFAKDFMKKFVKENSGKKLFGLSIGNEAADEPIHHIMNSYGLYSALVGNLIGLQDTLATYHLADEQETGQLILQLSGH
ncbi:hypothetical protein BY996DRAFT_6410518 [Phakopsora pachyrhizi]|nr:hypothetical protein BY996DRAFT_6410518 [Phakopsora pachyrhizi]